MKQPKRTPKARRIADSLRRAEERRRELKRLQWWHRNRPPGY